MTRFTRLALAQPSVTLLVMVLALVGGIAAARSLNQELAPDVEFPQATIVTLWPGASADEVTASVVDPIEKALLRLDDVDVVEVSSAASESFGAVTVRAAFGTRQDTLKDEIEARLADVSLPDDAQEPEVVLFDFADLPVVQASASGDLEPVLLQRLVLERVVPEIEAIDGVSRVSVTGVRTETMFVTLDPDRMAEEGVTVDQIRGALAANDLSFPAGSLDLDGQSVPVQVTHRIRSADDLRGLALGGGAGGAAGPPAGPAAEGGRPGGLTPGERPAATAPAEAAVVGALPLPAELAVLGLRTTDDLTPELVRDLDLTDPALLRQIAAGLIESVPPGTRIALPPGVLEALPADVRADLLARAGAAAAAAGAPAAAPPTAMPTAPAGTGALGRSTAVAAGPGAAAQPTAVPRAGAAEVPRTRVVLVAEGDTLAGIALRFGVDPETVRVANGLAGDALVPGQVLRVPLPADALALPVAWRALGASTAAEITPEIMAEALVRAPGAVSDLSSAQVLALPDETLVVLPLSFLMRQPDDVRAALVGRLARTPSGGAPDAIPVTPATRPLSFPLGPARQAAEAAPPTLGDVATVERGPEDPQTINRTDGRPSLGLLVAKEQSANTVRVVEAVGDAIVELEDDEALADVEFDIVFEQATFIEESLAGVRNEGLLGALFAVLVILVFLSFSVRSTLVTAISIPLSVVIAFLLMRFQGLTLNLLTLSGLTVAIGRVVDDAIVVLENIYRHIQRGESRLQAVLEGTAEVSSAITASTLVTVAVFLPLGFVGGLTTQFFRPFALTVTYALGASLLVAVTIVPLLARAFLSRENLPEERETALQRAYTPILVWALDHRGLTLVAAFAFFLVSLALARFIPQTFLPSFGESAITVDLGLPPGTSLERTDEVAAEVETLLAADEDIAVVQTTVGSSGAGMDFFGPATGGDSARAFFFATFDEAATVEPDDVAVRLRRKLRGLAADEPMTFTVRAGAVGGPGGGAFDLAVRADDEGLLEGANARILAALADEDNWDGYEDVPLVNLESNLTGARQVVAVEVDPVEAAGRGLSTAQVAFALRQVLAGADLGDVEIVDGGQAETLPVVARFPADTIGSVDALADHEIQGPQGPVRLGDVATIEERPGPVQVTRVDGERAALIVGEITTDDTFGVTDRAGEIIADLELPDEVEVGAGVESSQQREGFRDMVVALPISILIVYLILVVTFGSLVHPFTILFSLPFAASGALVALAATGRALSISSLIGMMMLVGIVVTNAVVLVDLVQQYRNRGMDAREALIRGGRTRLRPILMTAVATVFALLPQAAGFTEGALIASELATVVIGGLTVSTLLTLIVVPVMYSLLDGLSHRETTNV